MRGLVQAQLGFQVLNVFVEVLFRPQAAVPLYYPGARQLRCFSVVFETVVCVLPCACH